MPTLTLRQAGPTAMEASSAAEGGWHVTIAVPGVGENTPPAADALKPTELLALSLAGCKAMSALLYAGRKGLNVHGIFVDVTYEMADSPRRMTRIRVHFRGLKEQLEPGALERVTAAINSCAVAATLHDAPELDTVID